MTDATVSITADETGEAMGGVWASGLERIHVSLPREDGAGVEWSCNECGATLTDEEREETCPSGHDETDLHIVERMPHAWANSAAIHLHEDNDSISVSISVGDPRGAFVMRVDRMEDGSLRLSVPHPNDSLPHMTLTPTSTYPTGFYIVG